MADDDDEDVDVGFPSDSPDASSGREVRKRQQALLRQLRADADVIRKVMLSPQGRSWIWRKLLATRAFLPNYLPGADSPNIYDTIYYEGQRKFGLDLLSEVMAASTDLYLTMVRENQAPPPA